MTRYNLRDNQQATISQRPLTLSVSGGRPGEIAVTARHGDKVERPAKQGNPGELSQLSITELTVIGIVPRHEQVRTFPPGTIVSLELSTARDTDGNQDSIMVCDIEVSGAPFRDMVSISVVDDGRLQVTALHPGIDPEVGDLAKKARAAARAHLRFDRLREAVHVLVAVDMSTSMAPALHDGSVGAALELITGVSQVIDSDRIPEVFLLTEHQEQLPGVPIKDVGSSAVAEIKKRRLGCGFRATSTELTSTANSLTYVITDAIPADVTALEAAHAVGTAQHLLVLGEAEGRSTSLPVTQLRAPTEDVDPQDELLGDFDAMSRLVESMLVTVPRAGSETE